MGMTRVVDLKPCVFVVVLACGGAAISSASSEAQKNQGLFLRCSVAITCTRRGVGCGERVEMRTYKVDFQKALISKLSDDQNTYRMTWTPASITANYSGPLRGGEMTYSLDINRVTGEFSDFLGIILTDGTAMADYGSGKCEKADSLVEKPRF